MSLATSNIWVLSLQEVTFCEQITFEDARMREKKRNVSVRRLLSLLFDLKRYEGFIAHLKMSRRPHFYQFLTLKKSSPNC